MTVRFILTTMSLFTDLALGLPMLQKLLFSADDIKGWRFLPNVQRTDVSFIYVMNTTDVCFNAICSQECNLTIVSHEEGASYLQNGTLRCRNRLQQCRITSSSVVSFSFRGSCSNSSDYVRLAVRDNRAGVCGDDPPLCFKGVLETARVTTTMAASKMTSTLQTHSAQTPHQESSSHPGTEVTITTELDNSTSQERTTFSSRGNDTNMTSYFMTTALPSSTETTDFDHSTRNERTTLLSQENYSNMTTHSMTSALPMSNETIRTKATVQCCAENQTLQSLSTPRKKLSKLDKDIALGVTVSLSVLVVSFMLFLIGRLLYRTRHVTKMETSVASFDIVNPSEGVFEDPSGFLSETYIHIRKVSESNTDETPTPSPSNHNQDSTFGVMTSGNPRTYYGGCSTFTGRYAEGFPHRYTAHNDRRTEPKPRK